MVALVGFASIFTAPFKLVGGLLGGLAGSAAGDIIAAIAKARGCRKIGVVRRV